MDDACADGAGSFADLADRRGIHPVCQLLFLLGTIDPGIRGGIEDDVRAVREDGLPRLTRLGQVAIGMG